VAEIIPIIFDFTAMLNTITSINSVSITVKTGIDANVSAMIEGVPQISGTSIIQLIKNGVAGASYYIRADVVSGAEKYALAAILPVESVLQG